MPMVYDGIFIKAQISEILALIKGEHIAKIVQNGPNEASFVVRKDGNSYILSLNVNPTFPYILLHNGDIDNDTVPSAFCMILRKYLKAGKILDILQINSLKNTIKDTLERVIDITIENIDDAGEIKKYHVFIEIMGKYSNIILTDDTYTILDVLKKNTNENARLKQKAKYNLDEICKKKEIYAESQEGLQKSISDYKALCEINEIKYNYNDAISKSYAGLSKKSIDYDENDTLLVLEEKINTKLNCYKNTNETLLSYLKDRKDNLNDSTEKKNIENIIKNLEHKLVKKIDAINNDISKSNDFDKYKVYGELLSAFGFDEKNIKNDNVICNNYNDNGKEIIIPIDNKINMSQNIKKYYDKYEKLKRTKEKATNQLEIVNDKLTHLQSIKDSLNLSNDKNDIFLIKEELVEYFDEIKNDDRMLNHKNIIKKRENKKSKLNLCLHHYKSSDGIDIYVGKNNLQNEYLTFSLASPMDTWLHIKDATGSHVILKASYEEISDKTLIEAAELAAYFSSKKSETKATVDYTYRKELKKVKGKAPGFCIYHKNYSINVSPKLSLQEI